MLTGLISVRELILALIDFDSDQRASLWYEQTNYMLPVPNPQRWVLSVGDRAIWEQTAASLPPIYADKPVAGSQTGALYGAVTVRELINRLLDEDADAKVIMTGGYPIHLRFGKVINEGRPHAHISASENAVWAG